MNWTLQITDDAYVKNSFNYNENDDDPVVGYPTDVKSDNFLSQLETFRESSHIEELGYNETVSLRMTIYTCI